MTDERLTTSEPGPEESDEQTTADDDVEGHVWLRTGSQGAAQAPDEEDDVEGHALYRSPASRGE